MANTTNNDSANLIKLFKTYFDKRNINVDVRENNFDFDFTFDLTDVTSLSRILGILDTLMKIHIDILISYECEVDYWYPGLTVYFDRIDEEDYDEEDEEDEEEYDADYDVEEELDTTNYDTPDKYKNQLTFKLKDGVGLVGYEEDIFEDDDDDQYWTKSLKALQDYIMNNKIHDIVFTDSFNDYYKKNV